MIKNNQATFEKNVLAQFGQDGFLWLKELNSKIDLYTKIWNLENLTPVKNLSYNYVLSGTQRSQFIILKISPDPKALSREIKALKAFDSFGGANILQYDDNALLLEKITPGDTLQIHFPNHDENAIKIISDFIQELHKAPFQEQDFPNISQWLKILDKDWDIPVAFLNKARILKNKLLKTTYQQVFNKTNTYLHIHDIRNLYTNWL